MCLLHQSLILSIKCMQPLLIKQIHAHVRGNIRNRKDIPHSAFIKTPGKTYPRMRRIPLLPPEQVSLSVTEALRQRSSQRDFNTSKWLSFKQISDMLGHAAAAISPSHRRHPSGGGLFPLELYLLTQRVDDMRNAAYHYDPDAHAVEELWDLGDDDYKNIAYASPSPVQKSACVLIVTGIWARSTKKYRDFAYLLALVETGCIMQNLSIMSVAVNVKSYIDSGFNDAHIKNILELPEGEDPICSIVLGA